MAYVGAVSYGLYLLNSTAIGVVKRVFPAHALSSSFVFWSSLPLSLGLAALSHRYLEAPFLRRRTHFRRAPLSPEVQELEHTRARRRAREITEAQPARPHPKISDVRPTLALAPLRKAREVQLLQTRELRARRLVRDASYCSVRSSQPMTSAMRARSASSDTWRDAFEVSKNSSPASDTTKPTHGRLRLALRRDRRLHRQLRLPHELDQLGELHMRHFSSPPEQCYLEPEAWRHPHE